VPLALSVGLGGCSKRTRPSLGELPHGSCTVTLSITLVILPFLTGHRVPPNWCGLAVILVPLRCLRGLEFPPLSVFAGACVYYVWGGAQVGR
jgi:hypothetical protein